MVTVCGDVNVPVAGEITGVAAGGCELIVMTEVAVALWLKPDARAMALTVVVVLTGKEPLYANEEELGWLPSTV